MPWAASHIVNWEDLSERAREAYRVVAEAVAKTVQGTQL